MVSKKSKSKSRSGSKSKPKSGSKSKPKSGPKSGSKSGSKSGFKSGSKSGSKSKSESIIVQDINITECIGSVWGGNYDLFSWKNIESDVSFRSSALIIKINNSNYVLTTRSKLINCKNLTMFYPVFDKRTRKNIVVTYDLGVLFQIMDFNLMLLGTKINTGTDNEQIIPFDFNSGQEVDGKKYDINHTSYDISNIQYQNCNVSNIYKMHSVNIFETDENECGMSCEMGVNNIKYVGSTVHRDDLNYLLPLHMLEFKDAKNSNNNSFSGSVVSIKNNIIGIVSLINTDDDAIGKYRVIPLLTIRKFLTDFIFNLSNYRNYKGIHIININYVNNDGYAMIDKLQEFKTSNGNIILNNSDIIVEIDNKKYCMLNDRIMIYCNKLKEDVDLDYYFGMSLLENTSINFKIKRNDEIFDYDIIGRPLKFYKFPIYSLSFFYPEVNIPYTIIGDVVIVELTYELLILSDELKINLNNGLIDNFYNDNLPNKKNNLIIIDTISEKNSLIMKWSVDYDEPSKLNLKCYILNSLNDKRVSNLQNLNIVGKNQNKYKLDIGFNINEKSESLMFST